MGQIGGTTLYATGNTRIQVLLGIATMAASLVVAYFMMAPSTAFVPGLDLASKGLAYKMVVLQVVSVNVQAWLIARTLGWEYDWVYQFVALPIAIAIGWLSKLIVVNVLTAPSLVLMSAAGVVHLLLMVLVVRLLPAMAGLQHGRLVEIARGFGRAA